MHQSAGQVYDELLALMLRLVLALHAEDRGLVPRDHPRITRLHEELHEDARVHGDAMEQRFGAWPRVLGSLGALDLVLRPGSGIAAALRPGVSDAVILRVLRKLRELDGKRLDYQAIDVEHLGHMYEGLIGYTLETHGEWVIRAGRERRRTGTHYTPRALSGPIVRRTLEPLLAAMRAQMKQRAPAVDDPQPTSERLLALRICDPAMGSGAFLVESCRVLADLLVAAWAREGKQVTDPVPLARAMVAQRCLFGVDKNPAAVELSKRSLWLLAHAHPETLTHLDHHLRVGDSLVGLRDDQIDAMDWEPGATLTTKLDPARRRDVADVVLSAFFWPDEAELTPQALHTAKKPSSAARRACLRRLQGELQAWLRGEPGQALPDALARRSALVRTHLRPIHWALELPELFAGPRAPRMDAVIGNPPFLGGRSISRSLGRSHADWLLAAHAPSHGNADLAAYFFRHARWLVGDHGTLGLIATNTIGQGDTRAVGLQPLVRGGARIYDATPGLAWPVTGANVICSIVHLAVGDANLPSLQPTLGGRAVPAIDSHLRARAERPDPQRLAANAHGSFQGAIVLGKGFVLTPAERDALVARDPRNAACIRPYIGGEELNASPTQAHARYVIDLGDRTLEQAAGWPELLAILETRVKPEREAQRRGSLRTRWWQYADRRPGLHRAIAALPRCLAGSIHSKHSIFAFQPTDRVFSHALVVFPLASYACFGLLQSRVHRRWAQRQGSSMRNELRYTPSECFATFPFPPASALAEGSPLHVAAQRLYEARAAFMRTHAVGLTKTYDALADLADPRPEVARLRRLHVALDRAVLRAYGHAEIAIPRWTGASPAALARFDDEVLELLLALNEQQARAEAHAPRDPTPRAPSYDLLP